MMMKLHLPCRAQTAAYSAYQHSRSLMSRLLRGNRRGPNISLYCKYHQSTGSIVAIASIANSLSARFNVDAYITPLSGYSSLLDLHVSQYYSPRKLKGNLVFIDIEQDNDVTQRLLLDKKNVVLSCHAFPTTLHAVPQPQLLANLEQATHIHFASDFQRAEFIRHYPNIVIEVKSFVIRNFTRQIVKHSITGNVGIVGHLNRETKHTLDTIQLAQQSDCLLIQCCGSDTIIGLDSPDAYTKLRINGWSGNLTKMHHSFDVLVSTNKSETFGLVVSEAMSAGIPCLPPSDIPVFRELFSGCHSVVFLSGDNKQDIQPLNSLLDRAAGFRSPIIDYWKAHLSKKPLAPHGST
jgi:glycosyltransferase involved in cell wall biosynthesis